MVLQQRLAAHRQFLHREPGVVQQVTRLLNRRLCRDPLLVEFPQRGQWTMAFVVGSPGERLGPLVGEDKVTVYVPTAPNPTSGYVIVVDPVELRDVDVSVDEAFKFHVSLGVVTPSEAGRRRTPRPAVLTSEIPGEASGR